VNKYIIVTDKQKLIDVDDNYIILSPREFIGQKFEIFKKQDRVKVINLSPNYEYLSLGYYVSLMCQARSVLCFPDLSNVVSLNWQKNHSHYFSDLNRILEKHYDLPFEDPYVRRFTSFFGRHVDPKLEPLTRRIFDLFRTPIFSFEIRFTEKHQWRVVKIEAESLGRLIGQQVDQFNQDLKHFTGSVWRRPNRRKQERYWIAILHDPEEKRSPSNRGALKKFIDVGKKMNVWVELITKNDFPSLLEFDALFIRETTAINNHTYRFAQKAEAEGIPTIDDTASIIKCCNKIYMNEHFEMHKIDTPKTKILSRKNLETQMQSIQYPCVIKIPDGSFSVGVFKINDPNQLVMQLGELFKKSELILCQEFLESAFDWRIGVLDQKPLFASKYFMASGHWQIYNHVANKQALKAGDAVSVEINQVPKRVLEVALASCRNIGDGLYGVDIKELENGRVVVIEVNDNPNIDKGVEDELLGDEIYKKIIESFVMRIERKLND
jgi:glutathione synthase/RimK-type ligase-like ATP-grasp enzyme